MIRFAQSLGLPLKEIAEIVTELQREGLSPEREIEIMDVQLVRLQQKAIELAELTNYLRAKREWVAAASRATNQDLPATLFANPPVYTRSHLQSSLPSPQPI